MRSPDTEEPATLPPKQQAMGKREGMGTEDRFRDDLRGVLAEVQDVLARVDPREVEALAEAVLAAPTVFVTGEGRSGLVARAFAMRLLHLGRRAHVVGETATPSAAAGDLLLALSGSGSTRVTRARAEAARAGGVRLLVVTAAPDSPLAEAAELRLLLPLPAGGSRQFGGSLFEQAALLLLDTLVLDLQRRLGESPTSMAARHATLE
jgi:6-phospho-3-hexuloisomerase